MRIQNKCIAAIAGLLSTFFLLMGCGASRPAESLGAPGLETPSVPSPSVSNESNIPLDDSPEEPENPSGEASDPYGHTEGYNSQDAFLSQVYDVAKAVGELDYATAYAIQRSEEFLELMDRAIGGSLPGFSLVYDGSIGSFWGRYSLGDSIVSMWPGYPPFDPDEGFDGYRSGERITSWRRGGACYMFIGNYVEGLAEGEYVVYELRDASPQSLRIIRLTCNEDAFTGDATIEIYTDGQLSDVITTADFKGCAVPIMFSGYIWNDETDFWEIV
jgi:hypothetical protein